MITIFFLFFLLEIASSRIPYIHQNHNIIPSSGSLSEKVITLRGGGAPYDDYEEGNSSRRRKPLPPSKRSPSRERQNHPRSRRNQHQYNRRRPSSPSALNAAAAVAKKTVDLTSPAAWTTLKGSGKAAFYLVSPKHVARRESVGVWRLDQSVGNEASTVCAANVEFTRRGDVLVKYEDQTFVTSFLFRERSWPQSCSIEFEARAFQGPHDDTPVLMRYKGYFRRKLADSKVIKIVGHIYVVKKKGWRQGDGKRIGSFVARRRLTKRQNKFEEDFEEYDDSEDVESEEEDFDHDSEEFAEESEEDFDQEDVTEFDSEYDED